LDYIPRKIARRLNIILFQLLSPLFSRFASQRPAQRPTSG
jgi:hypothetical protein